MSLTLTSLSSSLAIQQTPLSPEHWPFDLALLPQRAYLVGGSVRDALLQRQADYLDLDFVLPYEAVETARAIAQHYAAGFVVLDAEHQIARVVFANATVDFAQQIGPTIHDDLQRRDFTINAIAYHPHSQTLLDPLDGYTDLRRRRLCMVSAANLADDPLRLLRAYRQAAQLGFDLDATTQTTLRQLAPLLANVAAERVRGELDCLLSLPAGTALLAQAWQDGLLHPWLPDVTAESLTTVAALDQTLARFHEVWPDYGTWLEGWVKEKSAPGLHRSWVKATKLSQLLATNLPEAEATLAHLKYSRVEQQGVLSVVRAWQQGQGQDEGQGLGSRRQQYTLFKLAGAGFVGVALLGMTHQWADPAWVELMDRYRNPADPVAHPRALVSGRDLIQTLQLRPGPQIGELLEAIQVAQAEGHVTTAAEALDWAQGWLEMAPPKPGAS